MKTLSLMIIFVFCYPILASINEEAEGIKVDTNEDELEDEDPIIEDLTDIDLTSLPVVSREIRKSGMFDCEFLEEEFVTYSYHALARSGNRVEVHLAAIHQLPAKQSRIEYTNPNFPGIKGFLDLRPHLNCFKQDDPQVIDVIKTMLIPPSDKEYNFKNLSANINGEVGQPLDAEQLVFGEDFRNGFFIEAGSSDGEFNSDTLHFEINKGWTGLLVEPNPLLFEIGVGKNRKASLLPTCLATQTQPHIVDFDFEAVLKNDTGTFSMGGIVNDGRDDTFQVGLGTGGGNFMGVCLYQKSVCKVYRTEGMYCRYIQYIRILVFVQSGRVHLFIVNCLLKNKFNIHVVYYLYI